MRVLESRYPTRDWARGMTPFEILISTVLSQSTTVANERRGFEDLRARIGVITPRRVADTPEADVAAAIWHAGLGRQKAPRIPRLAMEDLERWTPPPKRKAWHVAIIAHGRSLCKARNPRCDECPVRQDCDWYRQHRAHGKRISRRNLRSPTKG